MRISDHNVLIYALGSLILTIPILWTFTAVVVIFDPDIDMFQCLGTVIAACLFWWMVIRGALECGAEIHKVAVADGGVWISSWFRRVWVPLDAIVRIEEEWGGKSIVVTLLLDRDTPFGREIKFPAKTVRVRTGLFRWTRDAPAMEDLADASGADYEYVEDD